MAAGPIKYPIKYLSILDNRPPPKLEKRSAQEYLTNCFSILMEGLEKPTPIITYKNNERIKTLSTIRYKSRPRKICEFNMTPATKPR
jgi:hypothetical protein